MEKKHIDKKVAVKGLINGFIAYGILLMFLFVSLIVFVSWLLNNHKDSINYDILKYTLPILAAFLAFFLIRLVCRLSTFDLFKKCKIYKKDVNKVSSAMNFFFIGCVIISVILILVILNVKFNNQKIDIQQSSTRYYTEFSEPFAEYLTLEMIYNFREERAITLIQVIIMETGLLFGLFSLVSTQKKYIEKYNLVEKDEPEEKTNEKVAEKENKKDKTKEKSKDKEKDKAKEKKEKKKSKS